MKACALHAGYYFMDTLITLTEESATLAFDSLRSPGMLPYSSTSTSPLINLQVKEVMQGLLKTMMSEVLEGLDILLKGLVTKASWANAFSVLTLLFNCIEVVQVTTDVQITTGTVESPDVSLRIAAYRKLDEVVFKDWVQRFHNAYKSTKRSRKAINPIRDGGLELNEEEGITQEMVDLVDRILEIMREHGMTPS
jgi:hypothetical protein